MYAVDEKPRCFHCQKLLAEKVTRPWVIKCGRCKEVNTHRRQGLPQRTLIVRENPECPGPEELNAP